MQARLGVFFFASAVYIIACGVQQHVVTSVDDSAATSVGGNALLVSFRTKETPHLGGFQTEVRLKLVGAQAEEFAIASLNTQCGAPVVKGPNRMMLKCYWAGHGDNFLVEKKDHRLVVFHMTYRDGMEAKVTKRLQTIALIKDYPTEFSTKKH